MSRSEPRFLAFAALFALALPPAEPWDSSPAPQRSYAEETLARLASQLPTMHRLPGR